MRTFTRIDWVVANHKDIKVSSFDMEQPTSLGFETQVWCLEADDWLVTFNHPRGAEAKVYAYGNREAFEQSLLFIKLSME